MNASHATNEEGAATPIQLRGTRNGLEILVEAADSVETIVHGLEAKLAECPAFFEGGDVTVRFDADPPAGSLGCLEQTAAKFGLRVVEVRSNREERARDRREAFAAVIALDDEHTSTHSPAPDHVEETTTPRWQDHSVHPSEEEHAQPTQIPAPPEESAAPYLVTGPIRSGCRLEAASDLVVFGDVNPGAEVAAGRNIVVLGALRGVAHASVRGGEGGFILALRLQPQQVRIGELLARPADADGPPEGAEIAYAAGDRIVVEQYTGKLPGGAAAVS